MSDPIRLLPAYARATERCLETLGELEWLVAQHRLPEGRVDTYLRWALDGSPRLVDLIPEFRAAAQSAAVALIRRWALMLAIDDPVALAPADREHQVEQICNQPHGLH